MDGRVIYEDENGDKKEIQTGKVISYLDVRADSLELDEEGQWLLVHTSDSSGNEGSIMIPRERIFRIHEGRM